MEPTKNKLSLTIFLPSFLFYLIRLYRLRYPCSLNQRQTFAQRSSSRSLLNELVQHGTRLPPRYRDILEAEKWETKATSAITLPKIYLNRRSTVSTLASPYYQLANSSVISTGFSRVSSVANTAASSLSRKTIVSHQQGNPCCRNWWKIEHVSSRHYENSGIYVYRRLLWYIRILKFVPVWRSNDRRLTAVFDIRWLKGFKDAEKPFTNVYYRCWYQMQFLSTL